ncbi:MAG: hypothetical protein AAFU71_13675 [Cyanobacteria bacterium J06632_22]
MIATRLRWAGAISRAIPAAIALALLPCLPPARAQEVAVLIETDSAVETVVQAQAGDLITVRLPEATNGIELWMDGQLLTLANRFSHRSAFGDRFSVILLPHTGTYTIRTVALEDTAPMAPVVTLATTYERLIAKADSLDNLSPQATETAIRLYAAAIDAAPEQVDPYLRRMGHTLASTDRAFDFTDPTVVYTAYQALTATEQATVRADLAKVIELLAGNTPFQQLFAAYDTLLSTGVAPANFEALLAAVSNSSGPQPTPEIDQTSSTPQEAQ